MHATQVRQEHNLQSGDKRKCWGGCTWAANPPKSTRNLTRGKMLIRYLERECHRIRSCLSSSLPIIVSLILVSSVAALSNKWSASEISLSTFERESSKMLAFFPTPLYLVYIRSNSSIEIFRCCRDLSSRGCALSDVTESDPLLECKPSFL